LQDRRVSTLLGLDENTSPVYRGVIRTEIAIDFGQGWYWTNVREVVTEALAVIRRLACEAQS
jgi:hypothetical protein